MVGECRWANQFTQAGVALCDVFSSISSVSTAPDTLRFMKAASKPLSPAKAAVRRKSAALAMPALKISIEVDPLVDVVRRHVHLSPSLAKVIKGDFMRLFQNPTFGTSRTPAPGRTAAVSDPVLSTQEAADLLGVSRPYIVARIEAGDIPLHQQVGNQRRVLKSAVLAWHKREKTCRRRALGQLGADLDDEIFSN